MNTILEQLKNYFNNTPRDIIEKEWNDFTQYQDVGPTIDDFIISLDESSDWHFENLKDENTKINFKKTPNYYSEFFYICK